MAGARYLKFILFVTSVNAALRLSCDPGEVSKSYNFTCDVSQSNSSRINWRKEGVTIAICVLSNSYCEVSSVYVRTYTTSVSGQTAILTIISVNRTSEGIYSCDDGAAETVTCDFTVKRLSCDPGEESKSHNFTCDVSQSSSSRINWRKEGVTIATCVLPNSYCEVSEVSVGTYTVSVSGQTAILTIISVNRTNEGIYSCVYGIADTGTCDFTVYARPESVSCQQPEYQLATGNVKVMCTATRIYPYPFCQFSRVRNGTMMSVTQNIDYQSMSLQGQPEYYNPTCSLSLPVQVMGLGSHVFSVRVYPNVTGNGNNDKMYGTDSSLTYPVIISIPTVRLDCPVNYSLENTTISCNCRETANTFLSANTSISQGSIGQSSGVGYTIYTFTTSRNPGEVTCQAKLLNWTNTPEEYTPLVAYGPDSVSVQVMYNLAETSLIDLCDQTQPVVVTVYCTTSAAGARPGVVYEFIINGTRISPNPVTSSSLTYAVTKGGPLSVQCIGTNSVFTQVSVTSQNLFLQVTEPPTAPPIIDKYQESRSLAAVTTSPLTVLEGNNKIRCRVEGGYPSVSSLSLSCDGIYTNTSVGNVVYVDVNVDRYMDASECSCTATHNSSCYRNNQTATKLNVLFTSNIVKFTANENTATIIVDTNSDVRLSCEAEGNPSPSLSLRKDGQQLTDYSHSTHKFNLSLKYDKIITECRDAGVYACQAVTGQTGIIKTVDVNVRCKYQLENSNIENMVYKVRVNGSIEISIPVFGYPEPTLHLDSVTALSAEIYNLAYTNQRPSYGVVSLQIYTVTEVGFQSYRLSITNSEGSLVYNFQIRDWDRAPVIHPGGTDPTNVGAIVGGIIAGILVIVVAVVIVVYLKRRGLLTRGVRNKNPDTNMQTLSPGKQKALQYGDIRQELSKDDPLRSPDEEITDSPSNSPYEEIRDVQPNFPYEEIKNTDFLSDRPDNFSDQNDIFSHRHRTKVDYENTVPAL